MAGEDINMLTMMCTKMCTVKTDKRDVYDSFVVSSVSLSLSHWYPGSGVVLDCIDS